MSNAKFAHTWINFSGYWLGGNMSYVLPLSFVCMPSNFNELKLMDTLMLSELSWNFSNLTSLFPWKFFFKIYWLKTSEQLRRTNTIGKVNTYQTPIELWNQVCWQQFCVPAILFFILLLQKAPDPQPMILIIWLLIWILWLINPKKHLYCLDFV